MHPNMYEVCFLKGLKGHKLFNASVNMASPNLYRHYHSDKVFGYKHRTKSPFSVPETTVTNRCKESNFYRLVAAYREHGHKKAEISPVSLAQIPSFYPQLNPKRYCLNENDIVTFDGIINCKTKNGSIKEAVEFLENVYTKQLAVEYIHLEDEEEIDWFSKRVEELVDFRLKDTSRRALCMELIKSQAFDNFLANKFTGLKRYGGEGAESMMGFFSEIFRLSAKDNVEELVLAMPHRGRLNLLTGLLNFPPIRIFSKLKGNPDFPKKYNATGDVLSHLVSSTDLSFEDKSVHITVLYNPSHLEAVNPVSMGKTRAKQLDSKDGDYGENRIWNKSVHITVLYNPSHLEAVSPVSMGKTRAKQLDSKDGDYGENRIWSDKILNIQIHGDAAIIGQGVNQECLCLSKAPHFEIGGSVHLVVNNQLGFTTPAERGRSSRYCTDISKIISSPVIHVNGDYPEEVVKATKLAFEYQRKFRKDVFIDMHCYRQWGHNELDDPTFTNPALYKIIKSRGTVPDNYVESLKDQGIVSQEECDKVHKNHTEWLNDSLKAADTYEPQDTSFKGKWIDYSQAQDCITTWHTGIDLDLMTYIGSKSVKIPQDFNVHPTLLRTHVKNRLSKVAEGMNIDWSTAETIAMGSLLYEGYNVRISGQDVGRGTFSHRHVMLVDQESNEIHIPLNQLIPEQTAFLEIANSILSEEAVLGYEYGMSVESPKNLVIWEAQFGDFINGAQIILDVFVTTGETKWLWSSGLVILLPHGFDGAGPEHSSSRLERFLQNTDSKENSVDGDNVNFEVCQPSTPAQYFHLLRRQILRNFRKPLVIVAPKTLLKLSECTSTFAEMASGTSFQPVIGDSLIDPVRVQRVLITAGKHYYSLHEKRTTLRINDTAIIRLESYCPFPMLELQRELGHYRDAKEFIWCQEEPRNMGAWSFVKPRFENLLGIRLQYCGRDTKAACAVGVGKWHQEEVQDILSKPFQAGPFKS